MKFNDYLNTETSSRSVQQGISIRDENREKQLEAQVQDLSTQVSKLKDSSTELASLKGAISTIKREKQEEFKLRVEAQKEAERATYQLETQRNFVDEINGLAKHAESIRESLQDMKLELDEKDRLNTKQERELLSLTATNGLLQNTQEELMRKITAADQRVEAVNVEKSYLADIIRKEQIKYDELITLKEEIEDKYGSIITQNTYLNAVRSRLEEEISMERQRNITLAESVKTLQESYNNTKYSLTNTSVEAEGLYDQINSLLKTLAESNNTNAYLVEKQEYLEAVLAKPRYTSEASIARNEGFKMPLGGMAINSRKNYLGTGKPTLLKFKKKESTNDNTE